MAEPLPRASAADPRAATGSGAAARRAVTGAAWAAWREPVLLAAGWLVAQPALAHVGGSGGGGFSSGLSHPVSGLDHLLAMVAVGLWGAQLGAPAIWLLPLVFPLAMAVGGFVGLIGLALPGVEVGIALSAVLLGAAILRCSRPPLVLAALLVGLFAVCHGHAHGTELPPGESGLLYSLGFVVATGLLHAAGILAGTVQRWSWGEQALRAAGAGVCAAGLFFLWRAAG